jgi:hypothetical protein
VNFSRILLLVTWLCIIAYRLGEVAGEKNVSPPEVSRYYQIVKDENGMTITYVDPIKRTSRAVTLEEAAAIRKSLFAKD